MGNTTKDATWYMKWFATVVLILGTAINAAGFHPEGPLMLLFGGLIWLAVSIRWREPSLIVTNTVMAFAGIAGLIYAYIK